MLCSKRVEIQVENFASLTRYKIFRSEFRKAEIRALSSVGRAVPLHGKGRGFKSLRAHIFRFTFIGYTLIRTTFYLCPCVESNHDQRLRSPLFYPLNYKGVCTEINTFTSY